MNAKAVFEIRLPQCEKGIGKVILAPDAPGRIDGLVIHPAALWPDDRGYFLEAGRFGQGLLQSFPAATTQISTALSYPGAIKAFHFHRDQTDVWCPVAGMLQVALVDLRPDSPTFGARNTLYVGELRSWQFRIPPGVGHGYKVLGQQPAMLVYCTDRHYNPDDEGRIAFNDPGINYDWELQHK